MKLNMQQIFHYSKELNLLEATHLRLLLAISGCMGLQVTSLFKADITQWVEGAVGFYKSSDTYESNQGHREMRVNLKGKPRVPSLFIY